MLQLTDVLKARPEEVPTRVNDLLARLKATEKELEKLKAAELQGAAGDVAAAAVDVDGVAVVTHRAEGVGGGDVRSLALDVRGRLQDRAAVVVVVGTANDRPSVVVALTPAAQERGLAANALVGVVGERIGGKGGGKPDVAQGGGTDVGGIDAAFAAVLDAVRVAVGR